LKIQHDLSEKANQQEVIEMVPPWIPNLLECTKEMAEVQRDHSRALQDNTRILGEVRDLLKQNGVNGNVQNITANVPPHESDSM
jgi:hypothetical protein